MRNFMLPRENYKKAKKEEEERAGVGCTPLLS
jgi:hypothetical protein